MDLTPLIALCVLAVPSNTVRLEKIFQFLDGTQYDFQLQGFLHVGNDYTVFLRKPALNDKHLVYELYETQNTPNSPTPRNFKPGLLAISEIPVEYIQEQLRIYRDELHNATHFDKSLVPGTRVKTTREWQIGKALELREKNGTNTPMRSEPVILRQRS